MNSKEDYKRLHDASESGFRQPTLFEIALIVTGSLGMDHTSAEAEAETLPPRPPFNAEYLLYLFLRKEEREAMIGDLIEDYTDIVERFDKRHADIWFYKQVGGSLFPLLRRALLRIGALVWLGRILQRLIS